MGLDPPPPSTCVHLSMTPVPLRVDVINGWPLMMVVMMMTVLILMISWLYQQVSPKTTVDRTVCLCTHLTSFGAGFAVRPNVIDFDFVLANSDFLKNPTIYITEIIIGVAYILLFIWARWQDKRDLVKVGLITSDGDLQTSKAPLESQAQGTSLFTRAAHLHRGVQVLVKHDA